MTHWLLILMVAYLIPGHVTAEPADRNAPQGPIPPILASSIDEQTDRVVAVGFGYQQGASSSLRIRTYDAQSGEMLSEDSFDLSVVNGEAKESEPQGDRIFAGAVALTTGGLSEFPMRVYDAESGRFLWHGHLNFIEVQSDDPRHQVGYRSGRPFITTRARLVSERSASDIKAQVLVQAVETTSGKPIWQQSFHLEPTPVEAVTGESDAHRLPADEAVRAYEVVVRFYEPDSGTLAWSDRLSTRDNVEDITGDETPDQAKVLPLFRIRERANELLVRAIRVEGKTFGRTG